MHLVRTENGKDAPFFGGKVGPWGTAKKIEHFKVDRQRTPEKQKEIPTLWI